MALTPKYFAYSFSKSVQFPCLYIIIIIFPNSGLTDKFMKIIHLINVPNKMNLYLALRFHSINGSRMMLY